MIKLQTAGDDHIGYATITECSDFMYWYSNSIGEVYPVYRESSDAFWVRDNEGYRNTIFKEDATFNKGEMNE
jgi:hypothetical protein